MAARDRIVEAPEDLAASPTFDLSYAVDDEEEPTSVTVFPGDTIDDLTTWISVDVDAAIDLEDVA